MTTNKNDKLDKASAGASFIAGLLTGWGIPANWARLLAGAIIGAIFALISISQSSCTSAVDFRQSEDGSSCWSSELSLADDWRKPVLPEPIDSQK